MDQRDVADVGMPSAAPRPPRRARSGVVIVPGDDVDADPMGPRDAGHAVAVDAVVDDEQAPVRAARPRRSPASTAAVPEPAEQHGAERVTGPGETDQPLPHAAHHLERLGLAVAEIGHHQGLAHGRRGVGGAGIQQHPLAHGLSASRGSRGTDRGWRGRVGDARHGAPPRSSP